MRPDIARGDSIQTRGLSISAEEKERNSARTAREHPGRGRDDEDRGEHREKTRPWIEAVEDLPHARSCSSPGREAFRNETAVEVITPSRAAAPKYSAAINRNPLP